MYLLHQRRGKLGSANLSFEKEKKTLFFLSSYYFSNSVKKKLFRISHAYTTNVYIKTCQQA